MAQLLKFSASSGSSTGMGYGTTTDGVTADSPLLAAESGALHVYVENGEGRPTKSRPFLVGTVMFGMLLIALVALRQGQSHQGTTTGPAPRAHHTPSFASLDLQWTISNEYTGTGGQATSYSWLEGLLVEPHRETQFQVTTEQAGTTYTWTILTNSGVVYNYEGPAVTHTFTELGLHHLSLTATRLDDDGKSTVQEVQQVLACKYVRREIRSLSESERKELLSAMSVLWKVKKDVGEKIYGQDYADIWSINRLHYRAASDQVCDHFHDGMAFVVAHTAITLVFEQSLQLVNPKLSVPYWDFTIEGTAINLEYDGDFNEIGKVTPLFTTEFFGGADPDDLMVKDGLWAYTQIPEVNTEDDRSQPNVYGLLRSPWDVDGRPFLTRGLGAMCGQHYHYFSWPTCQIHYDLNAEKTSFYDWSWEALYDPHGSVHIWVGGLNDCTDTFNELAAIAGDRVADDLRPLSFIHRKNLFRDKLFGCEGTTNMTTSPTTVLQSGQCGCLDYDLDEDADVQYILNTLSPFVQTMTGGLDLEQKRAVAKTLCQGLQSTGDQLESSSPLDPSFWPMHPTMERLFQYGILSGTMTDVSWPEEGTWTGTDGTTYNVRLSLWGDQCPGHRASDVFPYGLVDSDELTVKFQLFDQGVPMTRSDLTNVELLQMLNPRANALPYVYDNMDWSHCRKEDIDFSKLTSSTRAQSQTYKVFPAGTEAMSMHAARMAQMMGVRAA